MSTGNPASIGLHGISLQLPSPNYAQNEQYHDSSSSIFSVSAYLSTPESTVTRSILRRDFLLSSTLRASLALQWRRHLPRQIRSRAPNTSNAASVPTMTQALSYMRPTRHTLQRKLQDARQIFRQPVSRVARKPGCQRDSHEMV